MTPKLAKMDTPGKSYGQNTVKGGFYSFIVPVSGMGYRKGQGELSLAPIDFSHPKTPGSEKMGLPSHFFYT